jgi:hypothetical protein
MVVANHNVFGLVDTPLIVLEVYRKRGVMLRGMADRVHFALPLWRDLLTRGGAVLGTRENCRRLLEAGEVCHLPAAAGGGSAKGGAPLGDHLGARLAVSSTFDHPRRVAGGEEMYDILMDANHPLMAPCAPRRTARCTATFDPSTASVPPPRRRLYFVRRAHPTARGGLRAMRDRLRARDRGAAVNRSLRSARIRPAITARLPHASDPGIRRPGKPGHGYGPAVAAGTAGTSRWAPRPLRELKRIVFQFP